MSSNQDWPPEYEAVGILGEGAQGRVFKLRHRATGQLVAGKRFGSDDAKALGRVEREIDVLRRLRHRAIVSLVDVHRTDSGGFLLTDLVDGVSLEDVIETRGGVTAGRALLLSAQLADGLAAAARLGVVHRDVKPSNILICVHDAPKLVDFGSAMLAEATKRLTATGEWVGTPFYMAPEQIAGRGVEPRTDVWGLAASFYEAITGVRPFTAGSPKELFDRIQKAPVDLGKLGALAGDAAAELFGRCLAKNVEERPHAEEAAVELAKLARQRDKDLVS